MQVAVHRMTEVVHNLYMRSVTPHYDIYGQAILCNLMFFVIQTDQHYCNNVEKPKIYLILYLTSVLV